MATRRSCARSERRLICVSGPTSCVTPKTSSKFETTLPASEPRTTCGNPSATAIRAMISSGALPKLALRKPPTPAPVCSAACSVASPMSQARGTSETAASTKSATFPGWARRSTAIVAGARARDAQRMRRATAGVAYPAMLEAVLFDWGDTLMRWAWEPELLAAGHAAGLGTLGLDPDAELTARFRDSYLPLMFAPGAVEEVEYPGLVRQLLGESGIAVSDDELD